MKFQVICGNPPFKGTGDPLYMQITKAAYDTVLDKDGVMCMINPTTLVDNNFDQNILKDKYGDLNVSDFIYERGMLGTFISVDINNDLGIFIYSKSGEHNIFDDWIKEKRFGEEYFKDKEIIESIKNHMKSNITSYESFRNVQYANTEKSRNVYGKFIKSQPVGNNYVVYSFTRGHHNQKTGDKKWDWTTLLNSDNFIVKEKLPLLSMSFIDFGDNKKDAINLIKWSNTDFIQFIVLYYKASLSNAPVLFEQLPQPPTSGDFSDESLMTEFGLTSEQMKHIHKKMENYGWKTRDLVKDHKESSLLQFIDDLNNGNIKDSSPSGSEQSKTVLDN